MLSDALSTLVPNCDPNLLVGFDTADDAAVYRLSGDIALISTADFITPPVDDPWWFGQIAAANALSDVYSMGGRPLVALNLVMFPAAKLDTGILREILRGGGEKVAEAGACIGGGHTVDDLEPKYGLAVSGVVHPDKILTNAGARPGDTLLLTKPLGSGVLFNAVRSRRLPYRILEQEILPALAALNGPAMDIARAFDIHAATDITGFGIVGHALEMAVAAGCRLTLDYQALPVFPQALAMYRKGETTGSNRANRALSSPRLCIDRHMEKMEDEILFDPQTSGGLLLALPAAPAHTLLAALVAAGLPDCRIVGTVESGAPGIVVR